MILNIISALFLFLTLLVGCQPSPKKDSFEDHLDHIQYLIDQKKYSEGLNETNALLEKQPKNEKVLALKASLYIHRAGIGIKELLSLESVLTRPLNLQKPILPLTSKQSLSGFDHFISDLTEFNYRIGNIQLVNSKQYEEVLLALESLDQIEMASPGLSLFRGLIRILNFKYLWAHGKLFQFSSQEFCESTLTSLRNKIFSSQELIQNILKDFSHGVPKSSTHLIQISSQLEQNFKTLDQFLQNYENQTQSFFEVLQILWAEQNTDLKEQLSCQI